MLGGSLENIIFTVIAFLIGASIHEAAHAWTAYALGDPTPDREGRLTLNPMAHIDILGFIMIVLTGFGWAKPVSVNPSMFRGNRRLGMLWVAIAGPLSNLALAYLIVLVAKWIYPSMSFPPIITTLIWINLILFVFNLIPVFPLDGEKIVRGIAPRKLIPFFYKAETYGPFILLFLLIIGVIGNFMNPILMRLYVWILG